MLFKIRKFLNRFNWFVHVDVRELDDYHCADCGEKLLVTIKSGDDNLYLDCRNSCENFLAGFNREDFIMDLMYGKVTSTPFE